MAEREKNSTYHNPFPVTAVANIYSTMQNSMIVETRAITEAKNVLAKWLEADNDGMTIAITGEFGTGKTQLAIELLNYIMKYDKKSFHFICLDNPSISFLEMYKNRFLNQMTKNEVLQRLEESYFELLIDDLKEDEIYKTIVKNAHKFYKSIKLIKEYGLPKSKYDRIFESRLENVTKDIKFVPALQLLMLPQFEDDIWNWFCGADPTEALIERGVNFSINKDSLALEAIGVFAFLFGQQNHKFMLFIDEMEKIISNTDQTKRDSFIALQKLFETVKATKSVLILCGLPDYYDALPKDTKQRIGQKINVGNVSLLEVKEYIYRANETVNKKKMLMPLSDKIIGNIIDISNGNIRTIIRLLYHSCNWFIDNNEKINETNLSNIINNAFGVYDITNINEIILQILASRGMVYEEKKLFKKNNEELVVDIWVPILLSNKKTPEKGIEIYIVKNIITEKEFNDICKKIVNNISDSRILIIQGFISKNYNDYFVKKFTLVLKYQSNNFNNLLLSVIESEKNKYKNQTKIDNLLVTNEKIDQLSRIIRNALSEIDEKFIGKREFYYYMNRFHWDENDMFYTIPDKDSEFYLSISTIEDIISSFKNSQLYKNNNHVLGGIYLLREFNYIIYYMAENPNKIESSYTQEDMINLCQYIREVIHIISRLNPFIDQKLEKYEFLISYIEHYHHTYRIKNINVIKNRVMDYFEDLNPKNFYDISLKIRQISQNFCISIFINDQSVISEYFNVFMEFYYLLYTLESEAIEIRKTNIDLNVIREYYDLIIRYSNRGNDYSSRNLLSSIFENFERELRRMSYEREY